MSVFIKKIKKTKTKKTRSTDVKDVKLSPPFLLLPYTSKKKNLLCLSSSLSFLFYVFSIILIPLRFRFKKEVPKSLNGTSTP